MRGEHNKKLIDKKKIARLAIYFLQIEEVDLVISLGLNFNKLIQSARLRVKVLSYL